MKNITIVVLALIIIGAGVYFVTQKKVPVINIPVDNAILNENQQATTTPVVQPEGAEVLIGKSVEGRDIIAYNYGEGDTHLLFVGGIAGGYSWNTVLAAYDLMDYLKTNPTSIPKNIKVTVIPLLNPDGLKKVISVDGRFTDANITASAAVQVTARFNANTVDLNRNFDCDWKSVGLWQNKSVSGGSAAFSEPETLAIKNYVETHSLAGAVVWYSATGGVYASRCDGPISTQTTEITNLYAKASGYPGHQSFDFYETSGDMVNWLAKNNIPAISVLLSDHTNTEWSKNKKGIEALFEYYAK
ncbi:MAG: M14 family metallopeptidase [Minisyncoccota bacterium]